MYHYAANNPVKYTDPDGRSDYKELLGVAKEMYTTTAVVSQLDSLAIGLADVVAAGIAVGATGVLAFAGIEAFANAIEERQDSKVHLTYTMTNADGKVYSGRTSGYGDPSLILVKREASHHMKAKGFGNAIIDQVAYGKSGRIAIRGREQQLIDYYGGDNLM